MGLPRACSEVEVKGREDGRQEITRSDLGRKRETRSHGQTTNGLASANDSTDKVYMYVQAE